MIGSGGRSSGWRDGPPQRARAPRDAALPGGDLARARRYSTLAGAARERAAAHEEAVRHIANALAALDLEAAADEAAAVSAAHRAGRRRRAGQAGRGGRPDPARRGGAGGADGAPEELARAAIAYGGTTVWLRAGDDADLVPFLERALAARAGTTTRCGSGPGRPRGCAARRAGRDSPNDD